MSSDDDRIRFKNKHVLKHLAKSGSENPREKKNKDTLVELQSHLAKKASGVVLPYLVCQKITSSSTISSPALQKYQPASATAKLLAVQGSQATSPLLHLPRAEPSLPLQVPPSSYLFIASTFLTQERQSPFPFRYESQILLSVQG